MTDKGEKSEKSSPPKDAKVVEIAKKNNILDKLPPVLGKKASKSSDPQIDAQKNKKKYTYKDRIRDIKTGIAEIKANLKEKRNQFAKDSTGFGTGGLEAPRGRRMTYPYTFTAKLVQFPYKFHYEKSWFFKYWLLGSVFIWPIFVIMGRKSYSRANVETWRKQREELFGYHDTSS